MTDTIKTYLTKIQIGAEQSFKNLSIFPLLSDYFIPFDYLTIDDAVSKDQVEVMEGYACDAADNFDPKMNSKSSRPEAINFLEMAKESRFHIRQSARLVAGWRLKSKRCAGYALAHEDRVLRLSMVAKN